MEKLCGKIYIREVCKLEVVTTNESDTTIQDTMEEYENVER